MAADLFWANPLLSSMMKNSNLLAGFINVNTVSSGNPELEKAILKDVAGYGRQLGRVMDVMKILLDKGVLVDLNESEEKAAEDFKDLHRGHREEEISIKPHEHHAAERGPGHRGP